jgi:hypothetical protein
MEQLDAALWAAHGVGSLPGSLELVVERLPPLEQCVAVGRLARAWRRWATARRGRLRAERRSLGEQQVPAWYLPEAWPRLSDAQRTAAVLWGTACGDRKRWRRLQSLPWQQETWDWAAARGHVDVVRWLLTQQTPPQWGEQTLNLAARGGHLGVLRLLRPSAWAPYPPCPWSSFTCCNAAFCGHLDVLRWLRAQRPPCPWDEHTCAAAAHYGHLGVLRWLRAQDPPCPWDQRACNMAADGAHLDVLRWLRAQDPPCPWDKADCREHARAAAVVAWIDAQPDGA